MNDQEQQDVPLAPLSNVQRAAARRIIADLERAFQCAAANGLELLACEEDGAVEVLNVHGKVLGRTKTQTAEGEG